MSEQAVLSAEQVKAFHRDGVLVVPSFFDTRADIEPIQRGIHHIIGLLLAKYDLGIRQPPFAPETFDSGYQELIAHDRRIGGEVYDAVKQIPAFIRLVVHPANDAVLRQLRAGGEPGVAAGGYGIRIDNPSEERFRAVWHQDYPAQLRSPDGLVLWSPLLAVTEEMGPVQFCVGSHHDGPVPVLTRDPKNPDKTGAYALILLDEAERVARYPHIAPLTKPGDLVIIDFLAIHQSGWNRSKRSRWSVQLRYFNFNSPGGIQIGWCGSFAAGVELADVHPELVVG